MNPTATMHAEVAAAMIPVLTRRTDQGLFPRLAGINATTFDPPMSIEAVNLIDEMGMPVASASLDGDFWGIAITCWPKDGWMVTMHINGVNGAMGAPNVIHIVWMP